MVNVTRKENSTWMKVNECIKIQLLIKSHKTNTVTDTFTKTRRRNNKKVTMDLQVEGLKSLNVHIK